MRESPPRSGLSTGFKVKRAIIKTLTRRHLALQIIMRPKRTIVLRSEKTAIMRNITVSVTDETYRQARIFAAEHNTSVSAAVQYMLENVRKILRLHKPPERTRRVQNSGVPLPPPL